MVVKRGFVFLICVIVSLSLASAIDASVSGTTASVSNAVNLYAYEIKMTYSDGTPTGATSIGFLGAGTSFGSNVRGNYLYVYESKLDATKTGVSGSGNLFSVTTGGSVTLYSVLFIYADSSQETKTYYCGDGSCNSAIGETTSTCSADCGSGGGGAGGGGGGGGASTTVATTEKTNLRLLPSELSINAVVDGTVTREIIIENRGAKTLDLTVDYSGIGTIMAATPDAFSLAPGERKTIELLVNVGNKGLLTGKILFKSSGSVVSEVPTVINVRSENFLFDSSIMLSPKQKTVTAGETLNANIDLKQVGAEEKVDVVATYVIKDYEGNVYLDERETFYVMREKSYTKDFSTLELKPGKYVLGLEIVYPGAFATSSAQFEVAKKITEQIYLFVLIGAIALVSIFVVVWALTRKRKIKRAIRKRHSKI